MARAQLKGAQLFTQYDKVCTCPNVFRDARIAGLLVHHFATKFFFFDNCEMAGHETLDLVGRHLSHRLCLLRKLP